jgi:UDP-4-amino-4,6-dideoxy-N-acetyl-beta-L-altrosamine transaminase
MITQPIPYGKQSIDENDIAAVTEALLSDYLTQGPKISEFERSFSDYIGCKYSVAVANGTAALHLGVLALDLKEGQKVITTPITFAASANCVQYCGGEIEFVDIDPISYTIDIDLLENKLQSATAGEYVGIIPVDFAGYPVQADAVRKIADKYGLWVLEDACHAPGAYYIDQDGIKQYSGNGIHSDLSVFSFHPVKHIACGEGGMITTNNKALYEKLLSLRTHGITRNKEQFKNDTQWAAGNSFVTETEYPGWYMEMQSLGYNYRLTDFQAALGINQIRKADRGLERRKAIAARYQAAFQGEAWLKGQSGVKEGHAYHLYIIETNNRIGLYNYLRQKNIFAQVHYIPVHLMPYYRMQGFKEGDFPAAERYYSRCLSLPMYPTLSDEEQAYVIEMINGFFKK